MSQQLAYPHAIRDIIAEYRYKSENLQQAIWDFNEATTQINNSVRVAGGHDMNTIKAMQDGWDD